jgi:hypothetical protein
MPKTPKPDDKPQSERFIETARELGCDEDEAAFEEKLRRIATAKLPRNPKPPYDTTKEQSKKALGGSEFRCIHDLLPFPGLFDIPPKPFAGSYAGNHMAVCSQAEPVHIKRGLDVDRARGSPLHLVQRGFEVGQDEPDQFGDIGTRSDAHLR